MPSVGVTEFDRHIAHLSGRIAATAVRAETRTRLPAVIAGLAADLPTKNAWTLAEHAGEADPHGIQHLLARAAWDEDTAREQLVAFVAGYLADPDAVFIGDETGDLKKGDQTIGTQRQYTGTAGRTENAQVAVYLAYATRAGHALIDPELYLPVSWTDEPARCRAAGVPEDIGFKTKPALLADMIDRALGAGMPGTWVAGDEVYGGDPKLARHLEARGLSYTLAISTTRKLPIDAATSMTASRIAADLPKRSWQARSAGRGAYGERVYEWAYVQLHPRVARKAASAPRRGSSRGGAGKPLHSKAWGQMVDQCEAEAAASGRRWWLLVRRHPRTKEMAFYLTSAPQPVPLGQLVAVAGRRWTIEESFQASKGLTGLDQHQVRRWRSWRRWTLLVMAAHAVLSIATLTARRRDRADAERDNLIPLTCAEIRRLVAAAARQVADAVFVEAWSRWRRQHQYRARACHYARRERESKIK